MPRQRQRLPSAALSRNVRRAGIRPGMSSSDGALPEEGGDVNVSQSRLDRLERQSQKYVDLRDMSVDDMVKLAAEKRVKESMQAAQALVQRRRQQRQRRVMPQPPVLVASIRFSSDSASPEYTELAKNKLLEAFRHEVQEGRIVGVNEDAIEWIIATNTEAWNEGSPTKFDNEENVSRLKRADYVLVNSYEGFRVEPVELVEKLLDMKRSCQFFFCDAFRNIFKISCQELINAVTDYNSYKRMPPMHIVKSIMAAFMYRYVRKAANGVHSVVEQGTRRNTIHNDFISLPWISVSESDIDAARDYHALESELVEAARVRANERRSAAARREHEHRLEHAFIFAEEDGVPMPAGLVPQSRTR